MLIFNCTKAAVDFFTSTKKGKKSSPIEPAPHKTIAESIAKTEVSTDNEHQWHWLVHAKKVKRKNVLIVMDYHSRFTITLTGLKKGDELAFLNLFEHHLTVHVHEIMALLANNVAGNALAIENSLGLYANHHHSCAFYQRGDRSVQNHINDVLWHFEYLADEMGEIPQGVDLIGFDVSVNRLLRKRQADKDYFYPQHEFLHDWLTHYGECSEPEADNFIEGLKAQERAEFQAQFGGIEDLDLQDDSLISSNIHSDKIDNVISLDLYRKKK
ncbi:MAG: hypothetical protein OQL19_17590 [Gammaproteobacteria bacterium]|nr:hypothetical protein [Gammaproteobacteria bacterium]